MNTPGRTRQDEHAGPRFSGYLQTPSAERGTYRPLLASTIIGTPHSGDPDGCGGVSTARRREAPRDESSMMSGARNAALLLGNPSFRAQAKLRGSHCFGRVLPSRRPVRLMGPGLGRPAAAGLGERAFRKEAPRRGRPAGRNTCWSIHHGSYCHGGNRRHGSHLSRRPLTCLRRVGVRPAGPSAVSGQDSRTNGAVCGAMTRGAAAVRHIPPRRRVSRVLVK